MLRAFDAVLTSSDMSLDRVLGAGLPVAMVFHNGEFPSDLRETTDELARQYAGKVLMVMLAEADAPQAISRFGVRQFPTLVTARDGKTVSRQEGMKPADLKPHIAHLVGEGPWPAQRMAEGTSPSARRARTSRPISIDEASFEREVLQTDRPVLVDFWAPWCGPCRMVEPILEKIAHEYPENLKIAKLNVDENPGLARKYGAMSIPTMIVMNGGREVDRWVGALPESALHSRVAHWIQSKRQTT